MTLPRRAIAWLAVGTTLLAQAAPPTGTVQLPKEINLTGVLPADLDGDGRLDLVLACHHAERRELRFVLAAANGGTFASAPAFPPLPLDRDVVALTVADIEPRPGRELILLTPEQVVLAVPGDDGGPTFTPLANHTLVWPAAADDSLVLLADAAADLDGDGREDLLLPGPDGASLLLAGRTPAAGSPFVVPDWQSPVAPAGNRGSPARMDGRSLQLSLGDDGEAADPEDDRTPPPAGTEPRPRGPLLAVRTRSPSWHVVDYDGSGRRTVVALRNRTLHVWLQNAPGSFTAAPPLPLPLPEDRLPLFDPAFDVQLVHVTGDAPADLLLTSSARRDEEIEVRIDLFPDVRRPFAAKPAHRLRLQTLATAPQLADLDGDGHLDLLAATVQVDLLRGITGGGLDAIDVQLNVFRGDGKRFLTPAALITRVAMPIQGNGPRAPFLRALPASGGSPGRLLLALGDALVERPFAVDGERLQLAAPSRSLPLPPKARLQQVPGTAVVLVLLDNELLHTEWR